MCIRDSLDTAQDSAARRRGDPGGVLGALRTAARGRGDRLAADASRLPRVTEVFHQGDYDGRGQGLRSNLADACAPAGNMTIKEGIS